MLCHEVKSPANLRQNLQAVILEDYLEIRPEREAEVLRRIQDRNQGPLRDEEMLRLFREIMSACLAQQEPLKVAFLGPEGTFTQQAVHRHFGHSVHTMSLPAIDDVFDQVHSGDADFGVVPVENSLEGAVTQVNDLLTSTDLKVIGEAKVPVRHCLLATEETDYREIRIVYSHPQALAQCRGFLMRNHLEPRPYYDTAGAAKMLARENPKAAAAIASELSAELYNLSVIKRSIEDNPANRTRFLLLSRDAHAENGDKTSIIFVTPHKAGSLFSIMQLFAEAGINLTRIASMPLRSDPDNYSFFLDFEGTEKDPVISDVLSKMKEMTITMKDLGSYPAALPENG